LSANKIGRLWKFKIADVDEWVRKGWIVFKRIGNVMEVLFPSLLTSEEMKWIHEQN